MTTSTDPLSPAKRILLVDDNADAVLILSMSLRLKGYAVEGCHSGQQALELTQTWRPQALLLDISMPGMDGYETCRRLRQLPWGQDVVIIALTGYSQDEDRQRTQEAGFDWHLVKPVDLAVLPNLLTELIDQAQAGN